MANGEFLSNFQTLDYALGKRLVECFTGLGNEGTKSYCRFLAREGKKKVFLADNGDVQAVLRKIAGLENDKKKAPDLPLVIFWRQPGLVGDDLQFTQVIEGVRYVNTTGTKAMKLTLMPFVFTYDILFLAWDRATLEQMGLAFYGFFVPLGRPRSRFVVPCIIDGEEFEIGASMTTPRTFLASSETVENGRLFASRASVDVRCQAVYGKAVQIPTSLQVIGHAELML